MDRTSNCLIEISSKSALLIDLTGLSSLGKAEDRAESTGTSAAAAAPSAPMSERRQFKDQPLLQKQVSEGR